MIPTAVIIAFLTTILTLFYNPLIAAWNALTDKTQNTYATDIQTFMQEVKKNFSTKPNRQRMKEPNDFEGNPDKVRVWCRRMTLFFQSNDIMSVGVATGLHAYGPVHEW